MSTRLEYEGRFLADIEDFGIFQSKSSQAVAIDIFFNTLTYFQGDAQAKYSGYRTRGRFFVIGKVGDVLQEQVATLADATGWDGDLSVIAQETWQPRTPVQIIVAKETNDKDRTYYNAIRVLRADWQPARAGNVNEEDGRRIAARYTSALKSVVAKHRRQQGEQPIESPDPAPASPESPPESKEGTADAVRQAADTTSEWTPESVWQAFLEKAGDMSREDVESVWTDAILYYADGKALDELTQADLAKLASIDPNSWTPF